MLYTRNEHNIANYTLFKNKFKNGRLVQGCVIRKGFITGFHPSILTKYLFIHGLLRLVTCKEDVKVGLGASIIVMCKHVMWKFPKCRRDVPKVVSSQIHHTVIAANVLMY